MVGHPGRLHPKSFGQPGSSITAGVHTLQTFSAGSFSRRFSSNPSSPACCTCRKILGLGTHTAQSKKQCLYACSPKTASSRQLQQSHTAQKETMKRPMKTTHATKTTMRRSNLAKAPIWQPGTTTNLGNLEELSIWQPAM